MGRSKGKRIIRRFAWTALTLFCICSALVAGRLFYPIRYTPGNFLVQKGFGISALQAGEGIPIGFALKPGEQVYTVDVEVWNQSRISSLKLDGDLIVVSDLSGQPLKRVELHVPIQWPKNMQMEQRLKKGQRETLNLVYIGRKGLKRLRIAHLSAPFASIYRDRLMGGNGYFELPIEPFTPLGNRLG